MNQNNKGRAGWHQAAPNTSKCAFYFTVIAPRMKAAITTLALWGWFPLCLAKWINNRGGQRDD